MRRLPERYRPAATILSTLATGTAIGLVVTALVMPLLPGTTLPGNRHELPETRGWILARLRGDAEALNQYQVSRNVAGRAAVLQQFQDPSSLKLHTLTFLGGTRTSQLGQYGYVLTVQTSDTTFDSIPMIVTTLGDRVWYMRGGDTGRAIPAAPSSSSSPSTDPSVAPSASGS